MARSTKEDFQRLNAFSLYNKTGHTLTQEPLPRGFEIYNFGRGFHAHHSYIFSLSEICLGVEKNTFKELHQLYSFYPKIKAP